MSEFDKLSADHRDFLKGSFDGISETDPLLLFKQFYEDATNDGCADPKAMVLSTASEEGQPSSRVVYMRDLLQEGIVFYTNYHSNKGRQISHNDKVAALFYWDCSERQVRIEGTVEKVAPEISDDYFAARPRLSKIGAWASHQSSELDSRKTLEERVEFYENKYPDEVPRPPHWGGYIIKPHYFEFWQGRLGRLHDRICFKQEGTDWRNYRISP